MALLSWVAAAAVIRWAAEVQVDRVATGCVDGEDGFTESNAKLLGAVHWPLRHKDWQARVAINHRGVEHEGSIRCREVFCIGGCWRVVGTYTSVSE